VIDATLLLGAYLVGSVPFGLLIGRLRGVDVRRVGSGNIGATNVMRTGGKLAGLVTLCLDAAKGGVPVLVARQAGAAPELQVAAGVAAVIGHCYPIYLRLRGGRGVATATGAFALLSPAAMGIAAVVFAAVLGVTRIVSAASCVAALALPVAAFARGEATVGLGAISVSAIVLWRHRGNLGRIRAGTERRLGDPEAGR